MSSTGKKLINTVDSCVQDNLFGLTAINTDVVQLRGYPVIIRRDISTLAGKVAILSGGGSGHEPSLAGYVGAGMLTASVAGHIFASPPPKNILAGIRAVADNSPSGILLVVFNYTGDRLNFGMALERAKSDGLNIDMVVIGEDCALTSKDKSAGRRGLSGVHFINKIAGAMSESGSGLEEVVRVTENAARNMGTIGMSLGPCSVPGTSPSFQLEADEVELGLGVHGEAGVKRTKLCSAAESVSMMLQHMTDPESVTKLELQKGDRVALMVNNLGGCSVLELNIVAGETVKQLEEMGVQIALAYAGTFMTSLEMPGVSLTVLKLTKQLECYLTAPTSAPAWPKASIIDFERSFSTFVNPPENIENVNVQNLQLSFSSKGSQVCEKVLRFSCEALVSCERQLNFLDSDVGDADCGTTLKRGASKVLRSLENHSLHCFSPVDILWNLSSISESEMGGSSGALYSILFSAAAASFMSCSPSLDGLSWSHALKASVDALMKYGGAEPGDRTMLDALYAAQEAFSSVLGTCSDIAAFGQAVVAAEKGAASTVNMKARAGRASYVGTKSTKNPDAGAHAVGIWMRAIYEGLKSEYPEIQ